MLADALQHGADAPGPAQLAAATANLAHQPVRILADYGASP
jgi:hypothetical protein